MIILLHAQSFGFELQDFSIFSGANMNRRLLSKLNFEK
jgi:hypothetical protein